LSDVLRGGRIVAGNHDHSDASSLAILYRRGYASPDRVGERDQTDELKLEIMLDRRQFFICIFSCR
jgi:hypothetical protein